MAAAVDNKLDEQSDDSDTVVVPPAGVRSVAAQVSKDELPSLLLLLLLLELEADTAVVDGVVTGSSIFVNGNDNSSLSTLSSSSSNDENSNNVSWMSWTMSASMGLLLAGSTSSCWWRDSFVITRETLLGAGGSGEGCCLILILFDMGTATSSLLFAATTKPLLSIETWTWALIDAFKRSYKGRGETILKVFYAKYERISCLSLVHEEKSTRSR